MKTLSVADKMLKTKGFAILAHQNEIQELRSIPAVISDSKASSVRLARSYKGQVRLKRTFNMMGCRFWRVVGPQGHPNLNSDLSVEGLRDWGVI